MVVEAEGLSGEKAIMLSKSEGKRAFCPENYFRNWVVSSIEWVKSFRMKGEPTNSLNCQFDRDYALYFERIVRIIDEVDLVTDRSHYVSKSGANWIRPDSWKRWWRVVAGQRAT